MKTFVLKRKKTKKIEKIFFKCGKLYFVSWRKFFKIGWKGFTNKKIGTKFFNSIKLNNEVKK